GGALNRTVNADAWSLGCCARVFSFFTLFFDYSNLYQLFIWGWNVWNDPDIEFKNHSCSQRSAYVIRNDCRICVQYCYLCRCNTRNIVVGSWINLSNDHVYSCWYN